MNNDKLYNLGLVCGRFGHLHLGHIPLIESSIKLCTKTLVLVSSAQESNTLRNPFSIDTRINVIKKAFSNVSENTLIIKTINDLTNEFDFSVDWGGYVKQTVENYMGRFSDLLVYGDDESREKWFTKTKIPNTSKLILSRNNYPISATMIRAFLIIDDRESWEKYTPKSIYNMYDSLQKELLNVPIYKKIYEKLYSSNIDLDNYMKIYKVYEAEDKKNKIRLLQK